MLLAKFPERVLQHSTGKRRCGDVDVVACCQKLLRLLDEISKDVCGDERANVEGLIVTLSAGFLCPGTRT